MRLPPGRLIPSGMDWAGRCPGASDYGPLSFRRGVAVGPYCPRYFPEGIAYLAIQPRWCLEWRLLDGVVRVCLVGKVARSMGTCIEVVRVMSGPRRRSPSKRGPAFM